MLCNSDLNNDEIRISINITYFLRLGYAFETNVTKEDAAYVIKKTIHRAGRMK
jgi:hypothetical protein